MIGRQLIAVLRLDRGIYETIVTDSQTQRNSLIVMLIASALSAVGIMFSADSIAQGTVMGILGVVIGWLVAAGAITVWGRPIVKQALPVSAMLRLTGFTSVFAFGGILGLIPGVGVIGVAIGALLAPVGNTVGIKAASGSTWLRAGAVAFLAAVTEVGIAEIIDRLTKPLLA